MYTRPLVPTSSLCERFFSTACFPLENNNYNTLPVNKEEQFFLYMNRSYWDLQNVQFIIYRVD